jgi:peptidoglycan/xylan/chitin deacetylase (PgdA/CDA1 family)
MRWQARRKSSFPFLPLYGFLAFIVACLIVWANSMNSRPSALVGGDSLPAPFREFQPECANPVLENSSFKDISTIFDCKAYKNVSDRVIVPLSLQKNDISLDNWQNNQSTAIELAPWPEIHPRAQETKVPILMYHDILPKKEVFFDVTPDELEAHFQFLQEIGATPISIDWLISHLRTGIPLPDKPVLLSFDDGYGGHYEYVYPLLRKYNYPAVFSIYINKMTQKTGRTSVTWEQLKEMAADPLVQIVSHSVSHPRDLRLLSDADLEQEVKQSKQILEQELGIPINYFTYPEGKADDRVKEFVKKAGYRAALSMNDLDEHFAGQSPDLLTIGRFGQSRTREIVPQAWGGDPLPRSDGGFNFATAIQKREVEFPNNTLVLISGGIPKTIHADSRYQVEEIIAGTEAIAAVDGGFFSLKELDSNQMIGPVLSQNGGFIPGYEGEIGKLEGRPLVIITDQWVRYIPFDPARHNTLEGIEAEARDGARVTDAFVAAAWLVKEGQPQPRESFGTLYGFDAARHRAFWGINQAGQPVIGVSREPIDSMALGELLVQAGFREAVMLDSGASTSLAYRGESQVHYTPRPVPHAVALFPPTETYIVPISHVGIPCVIFEDSCASGG